MTPIPFGVRSAQGPGAGDLERVVDALGAGRVEAQLRHGSQRGALLVGQKARAATAAPAAGTAAAPSRPSCSRAARGGGEAVLRLALDVHARPELQEAEDVQDGGRCRRSRCCRSWCGRARERAVRLDLHGVDRADVDLGQDRLAQAELKGRHVREAGLDAVVADGLAGQIALDVGSSMVFFAWAARNPRLMRTGSAGPAGAAQAGEPSGGGGGRDADDHTPTRSLPPTHSNGPQAGRSATRRRPGRCRSAPWPAVLRVHQGAVFSRGSPVFAASSSTIPLTHGEIWNTMSGSPCRRGWRGVGVGFGLGVGFGSLPLQAGAGCRSGIPARRLRSCWRPGSRRRRRRAGQEADRRCGP